MAARRTRLILDITRLAARTGPRVQTGIDRVERAYLGAVLARDPDALFLLGTRAGQMLLPVAAGRRLATWLDAPATAPRVGPLTGARARRAAVIAALWPLRLGLWAGRRGLARALAEAAGGPAWYLNVGHQNAPALAAAAKAPDLRRAVMVHDTIPLDRAEAGAPARHLRRLLAEAVAADLAICPSRVTAADLVRHAGPARAILVAPLGVGLAAAEPPPPLPPHGPLFLCLGTIEPRKDQNLLLDLWEGLAADPPPGPPALLVLAGRVGRGGAPVAARAARLAARGLPVRHFAGLSDGAVAALMLRARALLAPSRAEGFGLPLAEAVARGLPVLAAPLPAYREVLGDTPVYLPAGDAYAWLAAVRALCGVPGRGAAPDRQALAVPDWTGHFLRVFDRLDGA